MNKNRTNNDVLLPSMYTVYRCKSMTDDAPVLKALKHGSDDTNYTLCGKTIDEWWFIENSNFTGTITCPKCIKILQNTYIIIRRIDR